MTVETSIGSLPLHSPFLVASGTFGYGLELAPTLNLEAIGAIVTKTITLEPRLGNPNPRLAELPSGLLNSIGLQNDGADDFLHSKLPLLQKLPTKLVASIQARSLDEWEQLATLLGSRTELSALELNFSCPNVPYGKSQNSGKFLHLAQDPESTEVVVKRVRAKSTLPLWVKLSPNVTDIVACARAAQKGGAEAVVVANTYFGMKINSATGRSAIGTTTGGVSGRCIRALTLYHLYRITRELPIPAIGCGGIETLEDALEYFILGAPAVQLGTVNFIRPNAAQLLKDELAAWGKKRGLSALSELIGTFQEEREYD